MQQSTYAIYSDEELMLLITEGRVAAFDELYLRYSPRLMSYFVRMLNYDRTMAEDAVQDLFLKIAQSPAAFKQGRSFKTWVYSVAHNRCKNFYRHKLVEEAHARNMNHVEEHEDALKHIVSSMDGRHFRQSLDAALRELSQEKREAFLLRYQEEYSIAEIAEIQCCPEGSVKSRLHYALKALEEKLKIFKPQ